MFSDMGVVLFDSGSITIVSSASSSNHKIFEASYRLGGNNQPSI